jgi:hypothetical protein
MARSQNSPLIIRILAGVALLFSVLFMPFWVTVILSLTGMVYFSYFGEALFMLLLSDVLYGTEEARFFGIVFISVIIAIPFFFLIEFLKKKLKFYN